MSPKRLSGISAAMGSFYGFELLGSHGGLPAEIQSP
jgi:hypothetical protein